jgi:hypothetical protein
LGASCREHD